MKTLESPLPKDALCQVWLKLAQWFWRPSLVEIGPLVLEEKILKHLSVYFRYFVIFSPWKRTWSFTSIWKSKFPLPKDALCQIWLKLAQYVVLEKKIKMWKACKHTDGGQQAIRKAHLSIQFRWATKTTLLSWQNYVQNFPIEVEKNCLQYVDRNFAEIVKICMMQTTFIPGILWKES